MEDREGRIKIRTDSIVFCLNHDSDGDGGKQENAVGRHTPTARYDGD